MPFVIILVAGMIAGRDHPAPDRFEWLYPLRFSAAAAALLDVPRKYASMSWKADWLAPVNWPRLFFRNLDCP